MVSLDSNFFQVWEYVPGWVVFLVPAGVPDFEDVPVWVAVLYSADALDSADGSDSVDVPDSVLFPDVCSHYSVLDSVLCSGYYCYCFSDDFLCLLFLRRIAPLVEL